MYYKLYRRRRYIYMIALFIGIFLIINTKNRKPAITIESYTEPDPCVGCPGENGQGVFLAVNMIYS